MRTSGPAAHSRRAGSVTFPSYGQLHTGLVGLAPAPTVPTPFGKFRDVAAPVYDDMVRDQVDRAKAAKEPDLRRLLDAGNVWDVA